MTTPQETPPFFHALAVFKCKRNRLYRIYVRPRELVFIWAGSGSEGLAAARRLSEGKIGGLRPAVAGVVGAMIDPSNKNAARAEVLDQTPLEQLIGDDERNMRAPVSGFTEVRIAKRSDRHARTYSDHAHQALLYLRHQELGNYLLGIASVEDVQGAMKVLPRVFPKVYQADIGVPKREEKCGCVFCRR